MAVTEEFVGEAEWTRSMWARIDQALGATFDGEIVTRAPDGTGKWRVAIVGDSEWAAEAETLEEAGDLALVRLRATMTARHG